MKKPWTWKDVELAPAAADRLQHDFELGFFRAALDYDPENVDLLVVLGDSYSKRGQIAESLEIDKRLIKLCPEEPTYMYNLACSHSLLGDLDQSYNALEKAIAMGYQNFDHIRNDADLENLRRDGRYRSLLAKLTPQT